MTQRSYHDFIKPDIPCVGCECFGLWIDQRFLDNYDRFRFEEPLAPLWNSVGFCEHSFAVKGSIRPDNSLECVLG